MDKMFSQSLRYEETPKCYQGAKLYRSENGVSNYIYDVLPDTLTLYPDLNPAIWREVKDSKLQTIFQEVEIIPFDEANPRAAEQLKPLEEIERGRIPEVRYANLMWDTFCGAIYDLWNPKCEHFVSASSGYDSRLMSLAIMDLYNDLGDDWLGNLYFIEADGEAKQFLKNMEMIGWESRCCLVYNEGAPDREYHERSFDFETAWMKLGVMRGFPVNFNWEAQAWLQECGYMPKDGKNIQIFYGYSSNEIATTMRTERTLYEYFSDAYRQQLSGNRGKAGNSVVPFHHFDVMRTVLKYGWEHIRPNTGLSQVIMKHTASKELAEIPSMKHREKQTTVRKISKRILHLALKDYLDSWFGKQFPCVKPITVVKYDPWWAHWCVASFCEQLLRDGHELRIGC